MKFILNTAIDPHFCALFSEEGVRLFYHEWENRRDDGQELWNFLAQHDVSTFTFLGGVSGPGGFSSLRVGAGVLNSLAFSTGLNVHSLRADFWQEALLSEKGEVLLNSFGDGVWSRSGKDLVRRELAEAREMFQETPVCVSWLSPEKEAVFAHPVFIDMKKAPEILLKSLSEVDAHPQCITDYEVPPVG